jgi:hypothetical protein
LHILYFELLPVLPLVHKHFLGFVVAPQNRLSFAAREGTSMNTGKFLSIAVVVGFIVILWVVFATAVYLETGVSLF